MVLDETKKKALIAAGFKEEVIAKWDPSDADVKSKETNRIRMSRPIGSANYEGLEEYTGEFTPGMLKEFLDANEDSEEIFIDINCPGGSVTGTMEMAAMIDKFEGKTTAVINALCASGATVVASACDEVVCMPASIMMLHCARGGASGTPKDLRNVADMLEKMSESISVYYKKRMDPDMVDELIGDEEDHWMTAEEALSAKWADRIDDSKSKKESDEDDSDEEDDKKKEEEVRRLMARNESARMALFNGL